MAWCSEYNKMVASCQEEVAEMKKLQAKCMAEQMRLDEESLERLKAQDEAKKVTSTE
jgi:hypothetical protein